MSNKFRHIRILPALAGFLLTLSLFMTACKKTETTIPPSQSTFVNLTGGTFFVTPISLTDSITVGVTSVAKTDRTITFSVSSPTGAVSGTHYTIVNSSVTIPAGKALGYIVVKGILAPYDATGRRDSLIFKLTGDKNSSVPPSDFNNTFSLLLRGSCFEGDPNFSDIAGTYANTFDDASYGPYSTTIVSGANTGTTGTITIKNLYNFGFAPLVVTLDWTDPNNRKLTFLPQNTGRDGGAVFGPAYAGQQVWLYPSTGDPIGTYSACKQTFTVNYQLVLQPSGLSNGDEQTILTR